MLARGQLGQVLFLLGVIAVEEDALEADRLMGQQRHGDGAVETHALHHAGVRRVGQAESVEFDGDLQTKQAQRLDPGKVRAYAPVRQEKSVSLVLLPRCDGGGEPRRCVGGRRAHGP